MLGGWGGVRDCWMRSEIAWFLIADGCMGCCGASAITCERNIFALFFFWVLHKNLNYSPLLLRDCIYKQMEVDTMV